MKDIMDKLEYKGKEYKIIFDLNVVQDIQNEYGTLAKMLEEAYGRKTGEPSIKALSFVVMLMVNEAIEIENEGKTEKEEFITQRMANRMLTEFIQSNGVDNVVKVIDDLMAKSLQGGENAKNE